MATLSANSTILKSSDAVSSSSLAKESAVTKKGGAVQPMMRKTRHVKSRVATVMPEIGLDEEPTSPVNRDETVTKRKPNNRIMMAPRMPCNVKPRPSCGTRARIMTRARLPKNTTVI